jgi:hypothetical protein
MAVSDEKCIQCGSRYRRTDLEQISPSESLDPDGTFMGLPYWFCSVECYKKAVRKYLDPRYDFDKQPEDDEDYCARVQNALADYHDKAGSGPLETLFSPVAWQKPHDYIKPEVDKALDAFQTKKIGEIAGAEIELHNRLFAEWQHLAREGRQCPRRFRHRADR